MQDSRETSSEKNGHPDFFDSLPRLLKTFAFLFLSILIIYILNQYLACYTSELGNLFSSLDSFLPIHCLIFFDSLTFITIAAFLLFLLLLFAGSPRKKFNLNSYCRTRPIFTFILFFPLIAIFLVLAPTLGPYIFLGFKFTFDNTLESLIPHQFYLICALIIAFGSSLSLAHIAAGPRTRKICSILFLLQPIPLLWWNALATWSSGFFPKILRPVLTLITVAALPLSYPFSQPISQVQPIMGQGSIHSIIPVDERTRNCYQAQRFNQKKEFYLSCPDFLFRSVRLKDGTWELRDSYDTNFFSNFAAIDPDEKLAYLFDGEKRQLHSIHIPEMTLLSTTSYRPDQIMTKIPESRLNYDAINKRIIISDRTGMFFFIKSKDHQDIKIKFLIKAGTIQEVLIDESRQELYVLSTHRLFVFDLGSLELKKKRSFEAEATGMTLDPIRKRFLISFPIKMAIRVYDQDRLDFVTEWNAPALTREMNFDKVNDLVLLTTMSGVAQVHDAENYTLIKRERIIPWIHGMAVIPETGQAVITSGYQIPVVWNYLSKESFFDFGDIPLRLFEKTLRIALPTMKIFPDGERIENRNELDLPGKNFHLMIIEPDLETIVSEKALFEVAGFKVSSFPSFSDAAPFMAKKENALDAVIIAVERLSLIELKNIVKTVSESHPKIPILIQSSPEFEPTWTQVEQLHNSEVLMKPLFPGIAINSVLEAIKQGKQNRPKNIAYIYLSLFSKG